MCLSHKGLVHGTLGVYTYYIHRLLHRLGVHTVNHLSVANASIHMTHGYGHLQVLGIGGVNHQVESEKIFSPEKVMVLGDKVLVNLAICSSISFSTIF